MEKTIRFILTKKHMEYLACRQCNNKNAKLHSKIKKVIERNLIS